MLRKSGQAVAYNFLNNFDFDWQATKLTIKDRVAHLYNNDLMSDVIFVVKDDNKLSPSRVPAHKFVLAASSSVFFAMFYGPIAEADTEIEVVDCENTDCLLEFFKFIYTDEVFLNWDNSFNILYLSKKYMIPSLTNRCCEYLAKTLTKENVLAVLQQSVKLDEEGLTERCLEFIQPVITQVVEMESFLYLDLNTLKVILQEDRLQVAEINLFLAVLRWCKSKVLRRKMTEGPESWKKVLGDVIYLIRFPCMTSQEFATHCIFSGLLTLDQIRDISYLTILPHGIHAADIIKRIPFPFTKRIMYPTMMSLNRLGQGRTMQNWSYKGAPDALDFTVNKRISMCGISLFGEPALQHLEVSVNTGEWIVKPEISVGMPDSGPTEGSYRVMFSQPVRILPFKVHTLVVIIKSPQSKFAKYNTSTYTCDNVVFTFNSSNESGNGTSSTRGQFPEFLFRIN
ncbi:BTB/POZ domain-containing protein 1-like [Rhopilema esculentum]|uniref:BTB/POZ domain-containing protein 1-like n=1 Tax=Rhopilema esculentum TaxID=499914 RepID=UPI0031D16C9B|eukprot:gene16362-7759_t